MWSITDNQKTVTVTRKELLLLLPTASIVVAEDRVYILPRDEEVTSRLGSDSSRYIAEYNDCDDFSWRAKGKAAGKSWAFGTVKIRRNSGFHVVNCYVNSAKELILWEPQTRTVYTEGFLEIEYIII